IKVGDSVNCTYYENVIRKIDKAGAQVSNRDPLTPPKTAAEANSSPDLVRKVTATVTAVDLKLGNLSFKDAANDRLDSARAQPPAMGKKVKVGDKVDFTHPQATLFELK